MAYVRKAKTKTILDNLHLIEGSLTDQIDLFTQMSESSSGRRRQVFRTLAYHANESLADIRVAINLLLGEAYILEDEEKK